MFTGIIEEIGIIREITPSGLIIEAKKVLEGTEVGDSIAVNGACLTVTSLINKGFAADIMPETLHRTNIGLLHYGDKVNLERALMLGDRLGGHLLLGHVDDTGIVELLISEETAKLMKISLSQKLMPYLVEKGFIAVDGVSLTIIEADDSSFTTSLVAYTLGHTTLGSKMPGDIVNLEVDIIAKYVEALKEGRKEGITLDFLKEYGFA